jgi:uncharacterized alkaline shock family protein YloU
MTEGSLTPAQDTGVTGTPPAHAVEDAIADRGTTNIGDGVVEQVAGTAAAQVAGVLSVGAGIGRAIAGAAQRVGLADERKQGVSVEVGERDAAVDVDVVLAHGAHVPTVTRRIRDQVTERIQHITGLHVTEVNVTVSDIRRPGEPDAEAGPRVR